MYVCKYKKINIHLFLMYVYKYKMVRIMGSSSSIRSKKQKYLKPTPRNSFS